MFPKNRSNLRRDAPGACILGMWETFHVVAGYRGGDMTTFFTSDLHLGHKSIIGMNARPFDDVEQMNRRLISGINERVTRDDTLWVLGDVSYRASKQAVLPWLKKINCRDLRLVRGNHDKDWEGEGVFAEICDYRELGLGGRKVCLFHYPIASWNGMHRGSVHLHGHSHNTFDYNVYNVANERLVWDVGVDANGFRPISFDEIAREMGLDVEHDEAWRRAKQEAFEQVRVEGGSYPRLHHHDMVGGL